MTALAVQFDGSLYTENFNSLAASGTSNTPAATPTGWEYLEAGTGGNLTYAADNGASSTGNTYSFGSDPDRAFGELTTNTVLPTLGVSFVNAIGRDITELVISYTGEQWRL